MKSLTLYDTMARRKRAFEPIDQDRVTMYVCGPTVYSYAHIGNARPPVVFDVLRRVLGYLYGAESVVLAANITDIDDKIMAAARESGEGIEAVATKFARIYREDLDALGIVPPTLEPRATDHIQPMIAMMQRLVDGGHAYAAQGHVLFSVKSYEAYGALSKRSLDDMIAGARVEVAPYKKDPCDFVLWKPSADDEPGWDSPWGRGRPGWHLECSAMCETHLGETIDIHGGGIDLVFPHHENEIAQSTCAHGGKAMANYWLHNGFLNMGSDKMSKSLGNVALIHDLLKSWPGEVLRCALLTAHYRAPLTWNSDLLAKTRRSLDRIYGVLRRLGHLEAVPSDVPEAFLDALLDDINTPKAMSELFALAGEANKAETPQEKAEAKGRLLAAGALMGLGQADPDAWFGLTDIDPEERAAIDALILKRQEAREAKDWALADEVRDELNARQIQVDDGPEGSTWRKMG
ncbi:MAG: cysteine--tRNA ligase [Oceanicaulis sp.]|uniref:Cysteine--tRNA ligase n=1 Tax=Maricaulis virginensis TaxID=144022 RepID=A0A9W6MNT1_9PROT|nr:cysteine--tRNA ligase [Maricaulis virginensis]MAC38007.1 cysteine--tRNA ligase [Oceanicaulis sp.]MBI76133.1 cysteine--tRNA ligase [Oceanicaulis sp.]GLK52945.1 cysteine--tRNA ligase [Maricaulis virginensis]